MLNQRTLENTICATGVGLHTGQKVNLALRPAKPNTGIVFRRVDLDVPVEIPAVVESVVDINMSAILAKGDVTVSNVEHLLAAFAGMGIDNAFVDVNAAEVPAMDGSAGTFVFLIQSAGIKDQDVPRTFIRIKKTISISDGERRAQLSPASNYKLTCSMTYYDSVEGSKSKKVGIVLTPSSFQREISRARSFSFARDEEILHNKAQSQNGNKYEAVIVGDYRMQDTQGLRYKNEFLRHQLLDTIGDLCLLGYDVIAEYVGQQANHKLNYNLQKALLADPTAWEKVAANNLAHVEEQAHVNSAIAV